MKIAIVAPYFYPDVGGSGIFTDSLSRFLAKDNIVTIYAFFPIVKKGYSIKQVTPDGIIVYRLPKPLKLAFYFKFNRITVMLTRFLNYIFFGPLFFYNFLFKKFDII